MRLLPTNGGAPMKYQPPFDPALTGPIDGVHNEDPDAGYANGNPQTGFEGSIPPAEAFEHVQREVMKVITEAGITPDHEDLTQLWQALQWLVGERLVASDGGGVDVYAGIADDGAHHIRSLMAGSNITLDLVESPADSGEYKIRIASTAGGGVGGAGDPLVNIGGGAEIYKGNITDQEQLRTLKGTGGIVVTQNANDVTIDGSGIGGGTGGGTTGDVIIRQRQFYLVGSNNVTGVGAETQAWTESVTPKVVGNKVRVGVALAHVMTATFAAEYTGSIDMTRLLKLQYRRNGTGAWTTIDTVTVGTNLNFPTAGVIFGPQEDKQSVALLGEVTVASNLDPVNLRITHNNGQVMQGRVEVLEYQTVA